MSSLRNHRVVIATLFLPNTAVLGDSTPSTPDHVTSLPEFKAAPPTARPQPNRPGPLKSIVEDLKVSYLVLVKIIVLTCIV